VVLTTSSLPAAERTEGGGILIVEVVPAYGNGAYDFTFTG
jgi:hypothetical protein